jgi:hypothetical protein
VGLFTFNHNRSSGAGKSASRADALEDRDVGGTCKNYNAVELHFEVTEYDLLSISRKVNLDERQETDILFRLVAFSF